MDLHAKTISFTQGKTGAKVRIPIHPELECHLLASPVFPTLHDKPGTGRSGLSVAFKRVMEKAGIDAGQLRARRGQKGRSLSALSFHSLRHSFTSALANEGAPSELRQKFTGHASAETNAIYTHHELETLRRALMKLPSLLTEN